MRFVCWVVGHKWEYDPEYSYEDYPEKEPQAFCHRCPAVKDGVTGEVQSTRLLSEWFGK